MGRGARNLTILKVRVRSKLWAQNSNKCQLGSGQLQEFGKKREALGQVLRVLHVCSMVVDLEAQVKM